MIDLNKHGLVSLIQLEPEEIKHAKVLSGVSPYVLRRVFGFWIVFVVAIASIVSVAPDLSLFFVGMTFLVMMVFTVLIFYQSRISEGWPAILFYQGRLGVVQDPILRQFLFVAPAAVKQARPMILKPNKKAVAIELQSHLLEAEDKALLQRAIWPSESELIALSYFKKRQNICDAILAVLNKHQHKQSANSIPSASAS